MKKPAQKIKKEQVEIQIETLKTQKISIQKILVEANRLFSANQLEESKTLLKQPLKEFGAIYRSITKEKAEPAYTAKKKKATRSELFAENEIIANLYKEMLDLKSKIERIQNQEEATTPADISEDDAYTIAFNKVAALNSQPHTEVNRLINKLINQVESLKGKEPTPTLTAALEQTYARLTSPLTPATYKAYNDLAQTMQGHSSTRMKVLGGIMLALSLAALTLAVVFAPVPLALTATTAALSGTSVLSAATSFGLFAASSKTGLAKDMSNINNTNVQFTPA